MTLTSDVHWLRLVDGCHRTRNLHLKEISDLNIKPAMSDREIACYLKQLETARAVLEYGIGGSTLLAVESDVPSLYSVDSDASWIERVCRNTRMATLVAAGRARCVHVDIGPIGQWGKPKSKLQFWKWPRYARQPWLDGYCPDLVLVDGRFRVSCILETLRNARPDTKIVVHDFSPDKSRYRHVLDFTEVVEIVDTLAVLISKGNGTSLKAKAVGLLHRYDRR